MTDIITEKVEINDVPAYLQEHKNACGNKNVDLVKNVIAYLRLYKVAPKHYTITIEQSDYPHIMIQIDEPCGFVDKQVSKSNFEFINGTCFTVDLDKLPSMEECKKIRDSKKK